MNPTNQRPIEFGPTYKEAICFLLFHRGAFLRLAFLPSLLLLGLDLLLGWGGLLEGRAGQWAELVVKFTNNFVFTLFSLWWFRLYLLGRESVSPSFFLPGVRSSPDHSSDGVHWGFFAPALLLGAAFIALLIPTYLVFTLLAPPKEALALILRGAIGFLGLAYIAMRFHLVFPARAIGWSEVGLGAAWLLSRRQGWRMFWFSLFGGLLLLVFFWVVYLGAYISVLAIRETVLGPGEPGLLFNVVFRLLWLHLVFAMAAVHVGVVGRFFLQVIGWWPGMELAERRAALRRSESS